MGSLPVGGALLEPRRQVGRRQAAAAGALGAHPELSVMMASTMSLLLAFSA
eukprot:CAMPEP_0170303570 /NCGR_PEP_ID=MMETSP0116_2-20130129/52107_1 /TAXON_ID=400756 /ORGANISM="Durinskia baltica, Strain CSIRO CS-38" /LENGTH=50 /DNA_ID=CAMNT_0010555517 /DNA_START=9 /DNA_END=158 /DNA_ORIENTATION=+